MRRLIPLIITGSLMAATLPALAQDLSAGSEASSWGLNGEEKARFEARVTDAVCALSGDCPADCGAGLRQMVLIRTADDVMMLATKNGQPIFTGAAIDLAAYCGQTVEVDGLMVGDAAVTPGIGAKFYQLQRIRPAGSDTWAKADRFTADWEARNPDAAGQGPWFRRDPRITAEIVRRGYLGLGAEADAAFIAENY